jgi:hypothetical protein
LAKEGPTAAGLAWHAGLSKGQLSVTCVLSKGLLKVVPAATRSAAHSYAGSRGLRRECSFVVGEE